MTVSELVAEVAGLVLIGLLAGPVARWLVPRRTALSDETTAAAGIVGSIIGAAAVWTGFGFDLAMPVWLGGVVAAVAAIGVVAVCRIVRPAVPTIPAAAELRRATAAESRDGKGEHQPLPEMITT